MSSSIRNSSYIVHIGYLMCTTITGINLILSGLPNWQQNDTVWLENKKVNCKYKGKLTWSYIFFKNWNKDSIWLESYKRLFCLQFSRWFSSIKLIFLVFKNNRKNEYTPILFIHQFSFVKNRINTFKISASVYFFYLSNIY